MTRRLPVLVGAAGVLVAGAVVVGVETHLFPGADAVFGVLGALALGYAGKTLAALGLTRPASPAEAADDD